MLCVMIETLNSVSNTFVPCRIVIGIDCRCGGHFCSVHRYSDMHECTFDYRQMAQSEIRKHNPVVAAEKVAKI